MKYGVDISILAHKTKKTQIISISPTQVTTTTLTIAVGDVNDNFPSFEQPDGYERVVEEGDLEFRPPLVVAATDADGPAQGGGKVFYSLHSVNTDATAFDVDPTTGEVSEEGVLLEKFIFLLFPPPEKAVISACFHTLKYVKMILVAKYFCFG